MARRQTAIMSAQDQNETTNGGPKPAQLTPSRRQIKQRKPKATARKRAQVSSEDLPKKTLEDALTIAATIKDNFGKTGATTEQIAKAMDISPSNVNYKYLVWSATAYGIITKEDDVYKVSEIGRKILARTYEGEEREGIIKAITTPSVLARFYSDYSSSLLPQGECPLRS